MIPKGEVIPQFFFIYFEGKIILILFHYPCRLAIRHTFEGTGAQSHGEQKV